MSHHTIRIRPAIETTPGEGDGIQTDQHADVANVNSDDVAEGYGGGEGLIREINAA